MKWQQAQPHGRARKPCEGHTVSVVDKCLYVLFGKHEDDCGNVVCPPLQMLNTETMSLSHPHIEQAADGRTTIPGDREGHSAAVIGQRIYVFGGTWTDDDDSTIYMNDLHVLDVTCFAWSRPNWLSTTPIEREGHTASVVGHLMYVFGGTWVDDDSNSVYLNDLHVFDAETVAWSQPSTTGEAPTQREGHTASVVGTEIFVFGGAGLDKEDSSVNLCDLHVLDTATLSWSQPQVSGASPQERRYHTAVVIDKRVFIFGGQYYDPHEDLHFECDHVLIEFDVEASAWSTRSADNTPPLRRACHGAGVVGKQVYIVGGRYWDIAEDDYIFLNDIHVLDTREPPALTRRLIAPTLSGRGSAEHADIRRPPSVEQAPPRHWRPTGAATWRARRCQTSSSTWRGGGYPRTASCSRRAASTLRRCSARGCARRGNRASRSTTSRRSSSWRCSYALPKRSRLDPPSAAPRAPPSLRVPHEPQLPLRRSYPPHPPPPTPRTHTKKQEHLYCDTTEVEQELALPLFAAADRFGVERLKLVCAATLEASLCCADACAVLTAADRHQASELRDHCVNFIVTHFREVAHATPPPPPPLSPPVPCPAIDATLRRSSGAHDRRLP